MANTVEYKIKVSADASNAINSIKNLGNAINSNLTNGKVNPEVERSLNNITNLVTKFEENINKPITKLSTFDKLKEEATDLGTEINKVLDKISEILSNGTNEEKLNFIDTRTIQMLNLAKDAITSYSKEIEKTKTHSEALKKLLALEEAATAKVQAKYTDTQKSKLYYELLKSAAEQYAKALKDIDDILQNSALTEEDKAKQIESARKRADLAARAAGYNNANTAKGNIEGRVNKALVTYQLDESDLQSLLANLTLLINLYTKLSAAEETANQAASSTAWTKLSEVFSKLHIDISGIQQGDINALMNAVNNIETSKVQEAEIAIAGIRKELENTQLKSTLLGPSIKGWLSEFLSASDTAKNLLNIGNQLSRIVGFAGSVNILNRAFRRAVSTIKELDKIMTETAVVTDFTVGDMWKQLGDYAKRASDLGLAISNVYEASTLYYQLGLNSAQVTELTTQTLKMARIAGLDAAEATDRMTAALRGFNMVLNETNATNVADVYSKLAAITASDVDEISTAMTKVASLANSANMSFENTAAFLSQIIETTRESAETAGTALKTVVARFAEVKTNIDATTDSEGTELSYNKIDAALKSVGLSLDKFMKGQEGLDLVLMRLAEKWDKLDVTTQRYIATLAAGSRQQSRFIALMSDYARTVELTTAAENAAGASSKQYEKTLESLLTKINQLMDAWDQFAMGIVDSDLFKGVIDSLKKLLEWLNKINKSADGFGGSILRIIEIFAGFGIIKAAFNPLLSSLGLAEQKTTLLGKGLSNIIGLASGPLSKAFEKIAYMSWNSNRNITGDASATISDMLTKRFATSKEALSGLKGMITKLIPILGEIIVPLLAIIAAVTTIVLLIQKIKRDSPEGQLKSATAILSRMNEELHTTLEELLSLNELFDNLDDAQETLNNLTTGTKEWWTLLNKVNDSILSLINEFPDLAQYVETTASGMMYITDQGREELTNKYLTRVNLAQARVYTATNLKNKAENLVSESDLNTKLTASMGGYTGAVQINSKAIALALNDLDFAGTKDLLGSVTDALRENGILYTENTDEANSYNTLLTQAVVDNLDELRKLNQSYKSNNEVLKNNTAQLVRLNNADQLDEKGLVSEFIVQYKANSDNTISAATDLGNLNTAELLKKYLEMMYGDQASRYKFGSSWGSNMTLKYLNDEGKWIKINDTRNNLNKDQARAAYEQMANSKLTAQDVADALAAWNSYVYEFTEAFGDGIVEVGYETVTELINLIPGALKLGLNLDLNKLSAKDILNLDTTKITNNTLQTDLANLQVRYQLAQITADAMIGGLNIKAGSDQYYLLITNLAKAIESGATNNTGDLKKRALLNYSVLELTQIILNATDENLKAYAQEALNINAEKVQETNANYNPFLSMDASLSTIRNELGVTDKAYNLLINDIVASDAKFEGLDLILKSIAKNTYNWYQGLTTLLTALEENKELLDPSNPIKYAQGLNNIRASLNKLFGFTLSADFDVEQYLNDVIYPAARGEASALAELLRIGTEEYLKSGKLPLTILNAFKDIKISENGDIINADAFIKSINDALTSGQVEITDILSFLSLNSLGAEFTQTITEEGKILLTIKTLTYESAKGLELASDWAKKTADSLKKWEGPLGKLSTLLLKLTGITNALSIAEARYNGALNDSNSSFEKRYKLLLAMYDLLNLQAIELERLAADALTGIKSATQYYYKFDETSLTLLPTEYGKLALEALDDSAMAKAAQAEYEILNEFLDIIVKNKAEKSLLELLAERLKEATKTYNSSISDLANTIKESDKDKIDVLKKLLSAEKEASNNLITSISNNFKQLRDDRKKELTESDITSLTRRLAYLRQDTSGSNALEIKSLEKELANMTQEYSDTLIDNSISDLLNSLELAYELRNKQIENQESILEAMDRSGLFKEKALDALEDYIYTFFSGNIEQPFFEDTAIYRYLIKANPGLTEAEIGTLADDWAKIISDIMLGGKSLFSVETLNIITKWEGTLGDTSERLLTVSDYIKKLEENDIINSIKNTAEKSEEESTIAAELKDIVDNGFKTIATVLEKILEALNSIKNIVDLILKKGPVTTTLNDNNSNSKNRASSNSGVKAERGIYSTKFNGKTFTNEDKDALIKDIEDEYQRITSSGTNRTRLRDLGIDYMAAIRNIKFKAYKAGGLNTATGPAWLDGTTSNPELVLNAQDTQNFLLLRDILRNWLGNNNNSSVTTGNYMFDVDINVDQLTSDYDVSTLAQQVENKIVNAMNYRNNTLVSRAK